MLLFPLWLFKWLLLFIYFMAYVSAAISLHSISSHLDSTNLQRSAVMIIIRRCSALKSQNVHANVQTV